MDKNNVEIKSKDAMSAIELQFVCAPAKGRRTKTSRSTLQWERDEGHRACLRCDLKPRRYKARPVLQISGLPRLYMCFLRISKGGRVGEPGHRRA